ncbi:MAG: Flp pilus assembly complex ATPase component TadA [Phycisphaerales bacterium]|nr:Flp pilus assembly complex ATPase component TadA [Phycisphaerales bacterium]
MTIIPLLAQATQLTSPLNPFLMLLAFLPWAWVVSTILDKDAGYYHLNRRGWNGIHLAAGFAALLAMLLVPIFWIGWPVGVAILFGDLYAYITVRNQAVPESEKMSLFAKQAFAARMETRRQARAARAVTVHFVSNGVDVPVPDKEDPALLTYLLAEELVGSAVEARASKLEITVTSKACQAAHTVDGIRFRRDAMSPEDGVKAVDFIKGLAGVDVTDRRKRQLGSFRVSTPNGSSDVDLMTYGSSAGMSVRIDFDRQQRLLKPIDGLGLLAAQLESIRIVEPEHERHGIVILSAPPGQGLATTSYSMLNRHDPYTCNIKTLEREIEGRLDGVDQVTFDPNNPDVDFATNLQSILRRDPDIVMVADDVDAETAKVAAEPGTQGPLIYVPFHAGTVGDAIREWVQRVGDVKQATRALRLVTCQRLLRTLCPQCRQAYTPSPEQLQKLGLAPGKVSQLHRPSGKIQVKNKIEPCPICGGTGYLGLTGAMEVMVVDADARKLLAAGDLKGAMAHARRHKMIYLQEAAMSKVLSGETSIEEVLRVLGGGKSSGAKKAPAPQPNASATS